MKHLNKFYALFAAVAFVFCALLFSPPDALAGQDANASTQSAVQPVAAVDAHSVAFATNLALPITDLTIFNTPVAPLVAFEQKNIQIIGGSRQFRPPGLRRYGVVGWKLKSKFPRHVRTSAF